MGVLVVTPLLLCLRRVQWSRYRYVDSVRVVEIAVLLAGSLVVMLSSEYLGGVLFLAFPLVVLAAWRYSES